MSSQTLAVDRGCFSVLPIFLPVAQDEEITRIVFSPDFPDTAVVLYENHPPRIHDLRETGVYDAYLYAHGKARHFPDAGLFDDSSQLHPVKLISPARHAAYRPLVEGVAPELAIVFADDDTPVCRFNPHTGKRQSTVSFEKGCRVAYSNNGNLLAVGSLDGNVEVFALDEEEPVSERSAVVSGAVHVLCLQGAELVRVVTERNAVCEFPLLHTEPVERRGFTPEGAETLRSLRMNAMVFSEKRGLLACAGYGSELWVFNVELNFGMVVKLPKFNRVDSLQFVDELGRLLVCGDAGVNLLSVSLDAEQIPVFDKQVMTFAPDLLGPTAPIVGAHSYGNLLCIVHAVSAS